MKKFQKVSAAMLGSLLMLNACAGNQGVLPNASNSDANDTDIASDHTEAPAPDEFDARIYIEDNAFKVSGETIWLTGMNAPWQAWNDFGGNYNEQYWSRVFSMMHNDGFNSCRVWISCSGEVGINIDQSGYVSGATDKHWQDLDSLFALAAENEIYVMATLLSFDHFKNIYGPYEKWRTWLKSTDNIDSYINNYLIPFCERYNDNEYVWSIDLMNEPDWVFENEECGRISWNCLGDYFSRAAAAIHEHSDGILVTVGFGMIKYNSEKFEGNYGSDQFLQSRYNNPNAYLDFWSTHYYDWQAEWFNSPFATTPNQFGVDGSKPIVIGECSHEGFNAKIGSKQYTMPIEDCYEWAYRNGWSGVLAWTDRDLLNGEGVAQYRLVKNAGLRMKELSDQSDSR